jgi:hypothetical protein
MTDTPTWRQLVRRADVFPGGCEGSCRLVLETSPDGLDPWGRQVLARGDDVIELLDLLAEGEASMDTGALTAAVAQAWRDSLPPDDPWSSHYQDGQHHD